MPEQVECVVVGAGVIGLAVARRLARAGFEVIVVEACNTFGSGISARNSEVIHAGIYYPAGSLKARLCRTGRDRLYDYLEQRGIAHARCGKLIVAVGETELAALRALEDRARRNGVEDLRWLDAAAAKAMEPALHCVAALYSPSTGILDSHGFMLSLLGEAEAAGAALALASTVVGGAVSDSGIRLSVDGAEPMDIAASVVVNAAGLGAQAVAAAIAGFPAEHVPPLYYAKGNYFALAQRPPFASLVYPLPDEAGLGVHYTRDLAGAGRFGPDVEWLDRLDFDVDAARADRFYSAIRRYWPELRDGALSPAYAGIRPKIVAPGAPAADFLIQGPETHRIPGLVNLFGIESPGLTAAFAVADEVAARLALSRRRCAPGQQ
ncbi:MAG: NAD(P)/FAD-dependent oxidoreductase [Rhodospirillales bacterium]|nr:NAD(P)/FAD-dependent oxidoreductase [Rhodospirillales bacterium]